MTPYITGPGLPAYGAIYAYEEDSSLVSVIGYNSSDTTELLTVTRDWELDRDVLNYIDNAWAYGGTTSISKFDYATDMLGRREHMVTTGAAFGANSRFTLFDYNTRNELTESDRYNGSNPADTSSAVSTQQYTFDYDPIGNRLSYTGGAEAVGSYTTNSLNQYTHTTSPNWTFVYDADGNMTEDPSYEYTWDAENRLIEVVPKSPAPGRHKVQFDYDYLGRRVRKRAYDYVSGQYQTTPVLDLRFVYDGWNLLEELDGLSSNHPLRKYTWGLDLSGIHGQNLTSAPAAAPAGIHGAGGVGGLLATLWTQGTANGSDDKKFAYLCNGNGDIWQMVDLTTTGNWSSTKLIARYEHYPFGGQLSVVGSGSFPTSGVAAANPFRFSTKYRDGETGLYYYGYRYLKPQYGRWLSRDPAEEQWDINLYRGVFNAPTGVIDTDGREPRWLLPWDPSDFHVIEGFGYSFLVNYSPVVANQPTTAPVVNLGPNDIAVNTAVSISVAPTPSAKKPKCRVVLLEPHYITEDDFLPGIYREYRAPGKWSGGPIGYEFMVWYNNESWTGSAEIWKGPRSLRASLRVSLKCGEDCAIYWSPPKGNSGSSNELSAAVDYSWFTTNNERRVTFDISAGVAYKGSTTTTTSVTFVGGEGAVSLQGGVSTTVNSTGEESISRGLVRLVYECIECPAQSGESNP